VTTGNGTAAMRREQPALGEIRKRQRFGFVLAGLISGGYALLILLIAFMPELLARPVVPGRVLTHALSWSFLFALLTVAAMGLFVRHRTANDCRDLDGGS